MNDRGLMLNPSAPIFYEVLYIDVQSELYTIERLRLSKQLSLDHLSISIIPDKGESVTLANLNQAQHGLWRTETGYIVDA